MKNIKIILLLVFLASIFSGCKKYEDGPLISLRLKAERVSGQWALESYTVDGADSLAQLLARINNCNMYSFRDKQSNLEGGGRPYTNCNGGGGKWSFSKDKRELIIWYYNTMTPYSIVAGAFIYSGISWTILRLTNKEMWLEANFSGKDYEMHLKKTIDV